MYPQLKPPKNSVEKKRTRRKNYVASKDKQSRLGWKVVSMHMLILYIRSLFRFRLRLLIYKSQRLSHLDLLSLLNIPLEAPLPLGTRTHKTLIKTRPDTLGRLKH